MACRHEMVDETDDEGRTVCLCCGEPLVRCQRCVGRLQRGSVAVLEPYHAVVNGVVECPSRVAA